MPLFPSYDDEKIRFFYTIETGSSERTPAKERLVHVIPPVWNLCREAKEFHTVFYGSENSNESTYKYIVESNPPGSCVSGQLTDVGRKSMSELGAHFRTLYIDKLKLLDEELSNDKSLYLRSSDYKRAIESLQQLVIGLYPSRHRPNSYVFDIRVRDYYKETLYRTYHCARLSKLAKQFREAAKPRYESDLEYLTDQLKPIVKEVKFNSEPSCSSIFDTIISAKTNGIPMPKEFTDEIIDKIDELTTGEWFSGFYESEEMRRLSIGPFLADLREMILSKVNNASETKDLRFAMFSGHDSTMAPLAATFSAYDHRWPKFCSNIILELFASKEKSWFSKLFSSAQDGYFIRVKYNDKIIELSACQNDDQHHPNDKSLCTLKAFLALVDSHIPKDITKECLDE